MTYRIKGWNKFQHFKDRTPPWIKLYRDILDDPDWHSLDGNSAKALTMLWLIASEDETQTGSLPDLRRIAFRLRMEESKVKQLLVNLSHWIINDEDETISERYRGDTPEKRRDREEKETDAETSSRPAATKHDNERAIKIFVLPDWIPEQDFNDWIASRKTKPTLRAKELAVLELDKLRKKGNDPAAVLQQSIMNGWRGLFEVKDKAQFKSQTRVIL